MDDWPGFLDCNRPPIGGVFFELKKYTLIFHTSIICKIFVSL